MSGYAFKLQSNSAILNSVNSKSPLFRRKIEFPWIYPSPLRFPGYFETPLFQTFFHFPWDFEIAGFDCRNRAITTATTITSTNDKERKIFNRNTIKLSYSCMPNIKQIIDGHNKAILKITETVQPQKNEGNTCSCRNKEDCLLNGECLVSEVVYQATVTNRDKKETYIGLTATQFKTRYRNHLMSFRQEKRRNETELSKHLWQLKEANKEFNITCKILAKAKSYTNLTKRCYLCTIEKFFLICGPHMATLNKRKELVSTRRQKGVNSLCLKLKCNCFVIFTLNRSNTNDPTNIHNRQYILINYSLI